MTIQEIMKLKPGQRAKLSRSELAKYTGQLASAANKRLQRLEEAGLKQSPAYEFIMRGGGNFSIRGKDKVALDVEFQRAAMFIQTKTSTVKGAKDYMESRDKSTAQWMKSMGIASDYDKWSKAKKDRFWRLMSSNAIQHTIEQYYGNYRGRESIRIAMDIFQQYEKKTGDFAGYRRGHMKGSTKTFQRLFEAASKGAYELEAEAEAETAEDVEAYLAGKYGDSMTEE